MFRYYQKVTKISKETEWGKCGEREKKRKSVRNN